MIVRGTTPSIRYTFSTLNVADIIDAYLTIVQGETVIEKTLQDAEVGEYNHYTFILGGGNH